MAIDWNDVQAIILRGYKRLEAVSYVLLRIEDPVRAKVWLEATARSVTHGPRDPKNGDETHAINVAFTHGGLRKLGVAQSDLGAFSREFREGMSPERCRNVLGDAGESDPANWRWGQGDRLPDVLLLLCAEEAARLETLRAAERKRAFAGGLAEIGVDLPDGRLFAEVREHFGFRDGLSQPEIGEEAPRAGVSTRPPNQVAPGEFLLGYENERRQFYDPGLPAELSRHGSYLVFRQLAQEVARFWQYLDEQSYDEKDRDMLAAKMMGRSRDGVPLVVENGAAAGNDFGYADDPLGLRCPIGAHVRRANPRDAASTNESDPFDVSRMHRIIRRGRPYGAPLHSSWDPAKMLEAASNPVQQGPESERGIHFLCFNANIRGQFEFVQQTWINNRKFFGLYSETCPIAGARTDAEEFSIQGRPVRRRLTGVPEFVHVRGGAYFFMPGVQALFHLASGAGRGRS